MVNDGQGDRRRRIASAFNRFDRRRSVMRLGLVKLSRWKLYFLLKAANFALSAINLFLSSSLSIF